MRLSAIRILQLKPMVSPKPEKLAQREPGKELNPFHVSAHEGGKRNRAWYPRADRAKFIL